MIGLSVLAVLFCSVPRCVPVQTNEVLLFGCHRLGNVCFFFLLGGETRHGVTHFLAAILHICKKPMPSLRKLVLCSSSFHWSHQVFCRHFALVPFLSFTWGLLPTFFFFFPSVSLIAEPSACHSSFSALSCCLQTSLVAHSFS